MKFKVDVAVQSYKKPESLIYSLLSLHRECKDSVDEVWINDDKSGGNLLEIYKSDQLRNALYPWKVNVRENKYRMGWWLSFVKGYKPKYLSLPYMILRMAWNFYKNKNIFVAREDIRYQWAIDNTSKPYLFIMHDDVSFKGDIIKRYIDVAFNLDNPAILGDLGQCWRCAYQVTGCSPAKILYGYRPSLASPNTQISPGDHKWACRINEWCALLSVSAAKHIQEKHHIFFGNFDDRGDTSAYWFSKVVEDGFQFDDPLSSIEKNNYYLHWEDGKTGHSVWANQGKGRSIYDPGALREKLLKDFDFKWSWT